MSPADDPQRDLVYAMELRELSGHGVHRVAWGDLKRVAAMVSRRFGVVQPVLRSKRMTRYGWYDSVPSPVIVLDSERGRNYLTLAHELAHHVIASRHGLRAQDHGPSWVKVYAQILHALRLVPIAGTRAICRQYKVKIAR